MRLPATCRARLALVTAGEVFYPLPPGADAPNPPAQMWLHQVEDPLPFLPLEVSPFSARFSERWSEEGQQFLASDCYGELALRRALWFVDLALEEWTRSRKKGQRYSSKHDLPCPFPADFLGGPPARPDLPLEIRSWQYLPALVCYGWAYPLHSAPNGRVRLGGSRYDPGSALPVARWWGEFVRRVDQIVCPHFRRAHAQLARRRTEIMPALRAFRDRGASQQQVIFHQDDQLTISWSNAGQVFTFERPYQSYCLEDSRGSLHFFSGGKIAFTFDAARLSGFIDQPSRRFPAARITGSHRNPFVSEDGWLCEAGYFANYIGTSDLNPAAMILRALRDGVRILMTGGGNVPHTPFRNLANCSAPLIARADATKQKLPVFQWDHHQRGREAISLHA